MKRTLSPIQLAASAVLLAASLVVTAAAFDSPPSSGDGGGDPTVGTLPMGGGQDYDGVDQTLTLRGPSDVLRELLDQHCTGAEGAFYEVVPLEGGNAWVRLYGDVMLEMDLTVLDDVQVGVFAGFIGDGMNYAIGQREGFGSPLSMNIGDELNLDTIRLVNSGLLEQPLYIMALHNTGARTTTSVRMLPASGTIVIEQDI